jgi:negative regulator of flagellin synthesis FlgM
MKVESSSPDSYIGSVAGGPQKAADKPTAGAEAAGGTAAAAGRAAAAASPAQAGVTVTLSSSASQALSGAGNSDVFNADKVEAMKASIADGSFKVNAEAIADKMLSNAAEMLGTSGGGSRS